MKRHHFLLSVATGLFALTAACSAQQPPPASSAQTKPGIAAPHLALWGDLKPAVSVKELMRDILHPASDFIFDSASTVTSKKGLVETSPRKNKHSEKIRFA